MRSAYLIFAVVLGFCCTNVKDDRTSIVSEESKTITASRQLKAIIVKDYSSELALKWCELQMKMVRREPSFTPPVSARLIGYTGIILYESLVGGMPGYQSLSKSLNMPVLPVPSNSYCHYPISANAAYAFALRNFIPNLSENDLKEISDLEVYFNDLYRNETTSEQFCASAEYGRKLAGAIYRWSKNDGGEEGKYIHFKPFTTEPSSPGMWLATSYTGGLLPGWGNNRPFIAEDVTDCNPPPPPVYSDDKNSELYVQAMEVYKVFSNLTSEQTDIARFWADPPGSTFTPAGHSIQLLCQVIQHQGLALDSTAIAFVKCGIALNDAFIACWKTKYQYNYIRPITYIRKHIRKDWRPFISTPSFPEYPSGHSVQSGAMAEVMSSLFGNNYSFADYSNDTLGYPARHYSSFRECAREAAMSRLYGGIHYRFSIENGLVQGTMIGRRVNGIRLRK